MNHVLGRAPGKLLLTGEYAVLEGAPALVAAVDRRVHVRLDDDPGGSRISAVPLGIESEPYAVREGRLSCSQAVSDALGLTGRLLPRALAELSGVGSPAALPGIRIDSSELFETAPGGGTVKLGLGSSAAVTAALVLALQQWVTGSGTHHDVSGSLARWLPVYRDLMGARASGADLAASFAGGLLEYRDGAGQGPSVTALDWPANLHWLPIWVGKPAATTDFVGAFDRWRAERPAEAASQIEALKRLACDAAGASGRADALIAAAAEYGRAIAALGDAMGVAIVDGAHRRLVDSARRHGVVYKSCGAGGGDLGVALDTDPERLSAFGRVVSRQGAVPLHLGLSEAGASAEAGGSDTGD